MPRTALLNIVGLTPRCIGRDTPNLQAFLNRGSLVNVRAAFPAVTCTAQSTYLTGKSATHHGIVANGWYDRTLSEVQFWKQSNRVVSGPKIWESARQKRPGFTCAKLFWWYNMYSTADWSITPRPMYPADGRKFFDVYSWPYELRPAVKARLGEFPFPTFWGPAAGVDSPQGRADAASRWIADSAKWTEEQHQPDLSLVYLPHLDYNFQRMGPDHPSVSRDLQEIDAIAGDLIGFYESRGVQVLIVSEYGITPVDTPVHLNREFRIRGWLTLKEELGLELLDAGASKVFAVADHQVAHIYLNDPALLGQVRQALESIPGVETVLDAEGKKRMGIDHPRAGDLIAIAAPRSWFTYYYWLDDAVAPDFARCVDIHRKPGYDPVELFLDPEKSMVKARILLKLLRKKLGFRMLMDVIPLNASLVRGSHGRADNDPADGPLLLLPDKQSDARSVDAPDVHDLVMKRLM